MLDTFFGLYNFSTPSSFSGLDQFRQYQTQYSINEAARNGMLQGVGVLSNFISTQMQASAMDDYYTELAAQQAKARTNVLELTKAENDANIKAAQLRSDVFNLNANKDVTTAINLMNASINDLEQGVRGVQFAQSKGQQAYAVGGFENSGTVKTVLADINAQGMRDVNNNYRSSLNNINNYLSKAAEERLTAASDLLSAKEKAKFNYASAQINTQGGY